MKFNIAITAAALAAILTSLTSSLTPSARGFDELRAADKATWKRLAGAICLGCGPKKEPARSVMTNPIAVLEASPKLASDAVGNNTVQPKVRAVGYNSRYASLRRRHAQRYAVRMRKERDYLVSLKQKHRIQLATVSEKALRSMQEREEKSIRAEGSIVEMDRY